MSAQGHKDLKVFQKAYASAMAIFEISESFPRDEQYSLTDQIRRASGSVCATIGEADRKRVYPKHFVSKLSDSDAECTETMIFWDFAKDCGYLTEEQHKQLIEEYTQIGKMLASMMQSPRKFYPKEKMNGDRLPTAATAD